MQVRQAPSYRVSQTTGAHPVTCVETQIFAQRTLKRTPPKKDKTTTTKKELKSLSSRITQNLLETQFYPLLLRGINLQLLVCLPTF